MKVIKYKLCECGCGQWTTIFRGKPRRFIRGHQGRITNKGKRNGMYGRKWSPEQIEKMRKIHTGNSYCLGRKMPEDQRQRLSQSLKDHKVSKETRAKISNANKGKNNGMYGKRGSLHPCWKGGTLATRGTDWPEKRVEVLKRDGRQCMFCGTTKQLVVHHMIPYCRIKTNDTALLITLCRSCHKRMENEYQGGISPEMVLAKQIKEINEEIIALTEAVNKTFGVPQLF